MSKYRKEKKKIRKDSDPVGLACVADLFEAWGHLNQSFMGERIFDHVFFCFRIFLLDLLLFDSG